MTKEDLVRKIRVPVLCQACGMHKNYCQCEERTRSNFIQIAAVEKAEGVLSSD